MSAMRIAVDVTPLVPGGSNGGAKPFVLDLLRGLAARGPHTYTLLTAPHNHDEFEPFETAGVPRKRVYGRGTAGLHAAGFDLLYSPMTAPTFAEPGVATVSTVYDLQHLAYPWLFSLDERTHRAGFYRDVVEHTDHVVCISNFTRQSVVDYLHIPVERTSVVHINLHRRLRTVPTDIAWQQLTDVALRPMRFAFYPANFWPHKNHRLLLMGFARFVREHRSTDLHLVLTGEELTEGAIIRNAVEQMDLADRVHVLGFVSETAMRALWSVADLLIFPSLYEGFGIPVSEALHLGTPVLCSREGSLPEVGGDAVTYFDARDPQTIVDALSMATRDPTDLRQRAEFARGRLAAADPLSAVDRYTEIFEEVVAATKTHRLTRAARRSRPWQATVWDRRRALGTALMKSGRASARSGRAIGGVSRALAGALMAPEIAARTVLAPSTHRALAKLKALPFVHRWIIPEATRPWLQRHSLHNDGWAGPTLMVEVDIDAADADIVLEGSGTLSRLPRPLVLEAFLDRKTLGKRRVGHADHFRVSWSIDRDAAGRRSLLIVANAFVVPGATIASHDFRPLAYRLIDVRAEKR